MSRSRRLIFRENMAPPEGPEIYTGPMDDYLVEPRR